MTTRTSRTTVTFRRPFSLSGVDEVQPAGAYTVETDEEGLSFPVWRRTATVILLGANAGNGGLTQVVAVKPVALEAAQASNAVIQPEAAVEATLDDLLGDGVLQQAVRPPRAPRVQAAFVRFHRSDAATTLGMILGFCP
jgi:hypothetical protein